MKTNTLAITALSFLQLVAAVPSRKHSHPEKHRRAEDVVTVVDTVVVYATKVPEVVIFVSDGQPVSTMTEEVNYDPVVMSSLLPDSASPSSDAGGDGVGGGNHQPKSTSTPVAAVTQLSTTSTSAVVNTAPADTNTAPAVVNTSPVSVATTLIASTTKPTTSAAPVAASTASSAASAGSSSGSTSSGTGFGFSYDPWLMPSGSKTQAQITQDFAAIKAQSTYEFSFVRIYKGETSTTPLVLNAARANGWQVMAGISDITPSVVSTELAAIVSAVAANDNDWSSIKMIAVGNEEVGLKGQSASAVLSAVASVKSSMAAYPSYTGGIQTVDIVSAVEANPSLCDDNGGACTVNCHPFWDPNTSADQAGSFIASQITQLKAKLKNQNQEIIITETGWPWQAATIGQAVAGTSQQSTALSSIKNQFQGSWGSVVLFSPYNTPWDAVNSQNWGFITADGATQGNCPSGYSASGGGY